MLQSNHHPIRPHSRPRRALLAALASLLPATPTLAQSTATWLSPVDGNWSDPTQWSTNPSYPNNGLPPGSLYDAVIDATGNPYTITLDSADVTLRNLTLNSPQATLVNRRTLRTLETLDLKDGTLQLAGGSIAYSVITASGSGSIVVPHSTTATMSGVTIGAPVYVQNGSSRGILNLSNTLLNDATIHVAGTLSAYYRILGNGEIVLAPGSRMEAYGSLTLDPGITIRSAGSSDLTNSTSALLNQGTISASGGDLRIGNSSSQFTNEGTLHVANGRHLWITLNSQWSNTGSIDVDAGSQLHLLGPVSLATIGRINNTGGTVRIHGQIDNTNSTLSLDAFGGNWIIGHDIGQYSYDKARITGGKIVPGSGLTELQFLGSTVLTQGVVLDADAQILSGALVEADNLTLNGTLKLNGGGLSGATFLDGTGQVLFKSTGHLNASRIGPDITIRTQGGSGNIGTNLNQGLIEADGQSLSITGTAFTNEGTVRATNGAGLYLNISSTWTNKGAITVEDSKLTLNYSDTQARFDTSTIQVTNSTINLGGTFKADMVGPLGHGNTVNVTGTLDNTNSTLPLSAFGGSWNLVGGKIRYGTLGADGETGSLKVTGLSTLTGVAVNADLDVADGTLRLDGAWSNNRTIRATNATIDLAGTPSAIGRLAMTNSALRFNGTYTTAQVRNAATFASSRLQVLGTLDNTNDTLALDNDLSVQLSGRIRGGRITASGNGQITATGGTLESVTLAAPVAVTSGTLKVEKGLTLANGSIMVNASTLSIATGAVVDGVGEIILNGTGSKSGTLEYYGGLLTIAPDIMISTAVGKGTINAGLVNKGTIYAQGGDLILTSGFSNQGKVTAHGARVLFSMANPTNLSGDTLTGGLWMVHSNSGIVFPSAPEGIRTNAASIQLVGANSFFGDSVMRPEALDRLETNAGSLAMWGGRDLHVKRSLTNTGKLAIGADSELSITGDFTQTPAASLAFELVDPLSPHTPGLLTATGAASLAGDLTILLPADFTPRLGDLYTLLTASSLTGQFDHLHLPDLPGDWHFQPTYTPTTFSLTLVPEPTTLTLLLPLLPLLSRRRFSQNT